MNNRVCFSITEGQRDALLTLSANPAAWKSFDPRTWQSLASKALVRLTPRPVLTDAGRAAASLARALSSLATKQAA